MGERTKIAGERRTSVLRMGTQLEIAKHRLFDADGLGADNVKLFPGTSREVTSEQLAEQVNKALAQLETGDYALVEQFDD